VSRQAFYKIQLLYALRPIYTWVRFRIRLAHFPKYKNNYILKNGLAYCEIALRNRTCKQALKAYYLLDIYGCHTADCKPVEQEVNGTVILPPLVFSALSLSQSLPPSRSV
jgi:hypothetical protein